MNLLRFLLLASLLTVPAKADTPLVVLLGDSIRMNYQAAATEQLAGIARVWAPKENCRHTVFTLENLDQWLNDKNPKVIHINVGLHDMYLDAKSARTRHTLAAYEKNLRAIFAKLRKLTEAKVIFASTTSVNEKRQAASKGYKRVVRRNSDVDRFNQSARAIARETGIEVNDLNAHMKKLGADKVLRESDGIHLSPFGCKALGKQVAKAIADQL